MIVHRFAFAATIALLVATAAGCGAREGGPCQLNGDCAAGLFCCKNTTEPSARGVCRVIGATVCAATVVDAATIDAGDTGPAPVDANVDADLDAFSTVDADVDADVDAAAVDGGSVDAGSDAALSDAGGSDSGAGADAATDDADIDAF